MWETIKITESEKPTATIYLFLAEIMISLLEWEFQFSYCKLIVESFEESESF